MNVLVCGGAGYVGAHACRALAEAGHDVVVFDDLSTGHAEAVRWGELVRGDLRDRAALRALFARRRFDAVMHFAARSLVGESVADPSAYYDANVIGTWQLLEAMRAAGIARLIFSSTAAVYGWAGHDRALTENDPVAPINPYGRTKAAIEGMLADYAQAYGIASASLRYFNAAGADPLARIGEAHAPETHLIPNLLRALRDERPFDLFGDDYPTPDGTCTRDYVHVDDLAQAHLLALEYLAAHPGAHVFNLGSGRGFSVREIVAAAERVTGRTARVQVRARRPGDPPALVADAARARAALGWQPQYVGIDGIVETAWRWHRAQRYG